MPGSPAEEAGLLPGDVLLGADGSSALLTDNMLGIFADIGLGILMHEIPELVWALVVFVEQRQEVGVGSVAVGVDGGLQTGTEGVGHVPHPVQSASTVSIVV